MKTVGRYVVKFQVWHIKLTTDFRVENVPRQLDSISKLLTTFVTALSKHTRTAASHIFVFMISPDKREKKPYAIPIQCIPYRGMTLWSLVNKIVHEMHHRQMKVIGKFALYCVGIPYNYCRLCN